MDTRHKSWCFQCKVEYAPEVMECVECAVHTVGHYPVEAHEVGGADDAQLAYELHSWTGAQRYAVEEALYKASLAHGWQGPTLIVLEDDEDAVDEIIDLHSDDDGDGEDGTNDADADQEVPEVGAGQVAIPVGANADLQEELIAILDEDEIEHELLRSGFMLVPTEYETEIVEIFEALQNKYRGTDSFGPGVEGVQPLSVVEQLFLVSSTLRKSTRDVRTGRKFVEATELAHQLKLPFGFEAPMWRSVLNQSAELCELLQDAGDDDEIEQRASQLRELLHQYV